jgi:hypothetical protein
VVGGVEGVGAEVWRHDHREEHPGPVGREPEIDQERGQGDDDVGRQAAVPTHHARQALEQPPGRSPGRRVPGQHLAQREQALVLGAKRHTEAHDPPAAGAVTLDRGGQRGVEGGVVGRRVDARGGQLLGQPHQARGGAGGGPRPHAIAVAGELGAEAAGDRIAVGGQGARELERPHPRVG